MGVNIIRTCYCDGQNHPYFEDHSSTSLPSPCDKTGSIYVTIKIHLICISFSYINATGMFVCGSL